jgi:hypothetical protein
MPDTVLAMAAAGFCGLLLLLAFTVQRASRVYRAIVGTIAVIATLVTSLAFVRLASLRPSPVTVALPVVVARASTVRPMPRPEANSQKIS